MLYIKLFIEREKNRSICAGVSL